MKGGGRRPNRGPQLPDLGLSSSGSSRRPSSGKPLSHKERRKAERVARKGTALRGSEGALRRAVTSDPSLKRRSSVSAGESAAAQLAAAAGSKRSRQDTRETHGRDKRPRVSFDVARSGGTFTGRSNMQRNRPEEEDSEEDEAETEVARALDSGSEASEDELDIEDDLGSGRGKAGGGGDGPISLTAALSSISDPYAEEDEKLIASLEKRLGTKKVGWKAAATTDVADVEDSKSRTKALKRLNKEFSKDGLGEDFGDFLADLDKVLKRDGYDPNKSKVKTVGAPAVAVKPAAAASAVAGSSSQEDEEDDEEGDEDEGEGGGSDESGSASYEEEIPELEDVVAPIPQSAEEGGQGSEEEEEDEEGEEEEDEEDKEEKGQDVDSTGFEESADEAMDEDGEERGDASGSEGRSAAHLPAPASSSKYVPPHLRAKAAAMDKARRTAPPRGTTAPVEERPDLYGRDLTRGSGAGGAVETEAGTVVFTGDWRAAFFAKGVLGGIDMTQEANLVIRRKLQGLLNRLSESNVEAVALEAAAVYKSHPHAVCNGLLLHSITSALQHETVLLRPLALVYGAFIGALHVVVGPGVGAAAVERLTLEFAGMAGLPLVANPTQEQLEASRPPLGVRESEANARKERGTYVDPTSKVVPAKTRANVLLLLCYLLMFQVAHPNLLSQLSALLVSRFLEADVELLLLVLTYGGWTLRAEDPAALRDILKAVHAKLKDANAVPHSGVGGAVVQAAQAQYGGRGGKVGSAPPPPLPSLSVLDVLEGGASSGSAGGATAQSSSARMRVLGELLLDLKNNRKRGEVEQLLERAHQLRKWLTRLVSTREPALAGVDRRLRVSWLDVMTIPEMGRWWLVGSSWAGRVASGHTSKVDAGGLQAPAQQAAHVVAAEGALTTILGASALVSASGANASAAGVDAGGSGPEGSSATAAADARIKSSMSDEDVQLYELARAMRMNTPSRRSIFVALMGAEDVAAAVERCLRLDLKGAAEREIIRVAIDCVGQEAGYNKFFAQVVARLCNLRQSMRFTLQLSLWDCFKVLEDEGAYTSRRIYNLARFTADLMLPHTAGVHLAGGKKGDTGPHLNLGVLKPLPFTAAERGSSPRTLLFLKTLLSSLLLEAQVPRAITSVFSKVGGGADKLLVRDGVAVALHAHVSVKTLLAAAAGSTGAAAGIAQDELKDRLRMARKALESVEGGVGEDMVEE